MAHLEEKRFSRDAASEGLWHPRRFIDRENAGIYFSSRTDPKRTPVLFVHGYDGSPRDFAYLIAQLDGTRFQAWVYNYPSGLRLPMVAEHLEVGALAAAASIWIRLSFDRRAQHGWTGRERVSPAQRRGGKPSVRVPLRLHRHALGRAAGPRRLAHDGRPISCRRGAISRRAALICEACSPYRFPDDTRYYLVFTSDDRTVTVDSQLGSLLSRKLRR